MFSCGFIEVISQGVKGKEEKGEFLDTKGLKGKGKKGSEGRKG